MSQPALRAKTSHAQRADDRYIVQRRPLAADLGEIRDALCAWIHSVIAAAKTVPT